MKSLLYKNFPLLWSVFLFFSGWTGAVLMLWGAGRLLPADALFQTWGSPFFLLVFIMLCSGVTAFFMIYIHPILNEHPPRRMVLLFGSMLFSIGLFAYARRAGEVLFWISLLNTANLLFFANLLGSWLVDPLKRPVELFPICLILGLVDAISVFMGPTRKIAETIGKFYQGGQLGPVPVSDFILLKHPAPGQDGLMPLMGVSDWVAVVFFTASAARFNMNDNLLGKGMHPMMQARRLSLYMPVSAAGLIAAVLSAHYLNIFLPALPLLTLFFLVYMTVKEERMRAFTFEDWRLMGWAVLILLAVFGGVWIVYK